MDQTTDTTTTAVSSPPVAERPATTEPDPAARLHEMARELVRSRNRRLMIEFLRLRRAMR